MDRTQQIIEIGDTGDHHAHEARQHARIVDQTETTAVVHALLAIEARLNELTYSLEGIGPHSKRWRDLMTKYKNGADGTCVECGDDTSQPWQLYCTRCYFDRDEEPDDDEEDEVNTKPPMDWSRFGGSTPQPRPQPRRAAVEPGDTWPAADREKRLRRAELRLRKALQRVEDALLVVRNADKVPEYVMYAVDLSQRFAGVVGEPTAADAAMMDAELLEASTDDQAHEDGPRRQDGQGHQDREPGRRLR
jgi:hypothetical protein